MAILRIIVSLLNTEAMMQVTVHYQGTKFSIDMDLYMVLAISRMDRFQVRPHAFLNGDNSFLTLFEYFRETDADWEQYCSRDFVMECLRQLRINRAFGQTILNTKIDDSKWSGGICPEVWSLMVSDFGKNFPSYHNMIGMGLFDREIQVWCIDRLHLAGVGPANCFHRIPYAEQREYVIGLEELIFNPISADMADFYVEKLTDAATTIDANGRRDYWA